MIYSCYSTTLFSICMPPAAELNTGNITLAETTSEAYYIIHRHSVRTVRENWRCNLHTNCHSYCIMTPNLALSEHRISEYTHGISGYTSYKILRTSGVARRSHSCVVARPTTAPDAKTWSISILPRSFRSWQSSHIMFEAELSAV